MNLTKKEKMNSMKKRALYIAIMVFMASVIAMPKSIKLEYKPYKKAVYFVWLGNKFRRDWAVISELKDIKKVSGEFTVAWQTVDSDIPPPDDLVTLVTEIVFTPQGRKNFAHPPEGIFDIKNGLLVTDAIMDFPVLNRENKTYSIGETLEIPMKINLGYHYDENLNFTGNSKRDVVLTQKLSAIEHHLGFRCIKMEYGIVHRDAENAFNKAQYTLKGTLYFAIEEGITIYDHSEAKQTGVVVEKSEKTTMSQEKTVRLLHLTPLDK